MVRIDIAAQLYLAGRAPKVLLSGGALEGDVSEARGMATPSASKACRKRR